jgi:hypothetical protein
VDGAFPDSAVSYTPASLVSLFPYLTRAGHLKFIDFGTAKDFIQTDLNGPEFVGTHQCAPLLLLQLRL